MANSPDRQEVARRAYELFVSRGGEHGHDKEDWYQAEQELTRSARPANLERPVANPGDREPPRGADTSASKRAPSRAVRPKAAGKK